MSFESNSNSLQQLEQSVKIDGMLSQEEKEAFRNHFQVECGDINAETSSIVQNFLKTDLLPNIDQFDVLQQRAIRRIVEKHTTEGREFTPEDHGLFAFFGISEEIAQGAQEILAPFDMQFTDKLASYKGYIETELQLPANSNLTPSDHEKILSCIAQSIGENVGNIPELVSGERERYDNLNDREVIGIINDCIEEGFRDTKEKVLPNAKLFLASTAQGFFENSQNIFYNRGLDGDYRYEELEIRANLANERFISEVGELGECFISGDISDMPDVFNGWGDIGTQFEGSFGLENGIQEISNSCFLNEEDAARYKSAKIRAAVFMVLQILPTGVTDIVSMGIDFVDIFSRTDQSFQALKHLGVIDSDIHVGKAGWENWLSAVGFIGGAISLDVATKGSRMMRVVGNAGITKSDMLGEVGNLSSDLGLTDGLSSTLKRSISGFGINRGSEQFMEIARTNGRLSDAPGVDTFEIAGEVLQVSAREKAFLGRLLNAHETGEIPFSIESLEPEQIWHLLDTLNQMHNKHGSTPIGEHRLSQIADKIQLAKDNNIPLPIARLAIREGFAGITSEVSNGIKRLFELSGFQVKQINKSSDAIDLLSSIQDGKRIGENTNFSDAIQVINRSGAQIFLEGDDIGKFRRFLEANGRGDLIEKMEIEDDFFHVSNFFNAHPDIITNANGVEAITNTRFGNTLDNLMGDDAQRLRGEYPDAFSLLDDFPENPNYSSADFQGQLEALRVLNTQNSNLCDRLISAVVPKDSIGQLRININTPLNVALGYTSEAKDSRRAAQAAREAMSEQDKINDFLGSDTEDYADAINILKGMDAHTHYDVATLEGEVLGIAKLVENLGSKERLAELLTILGKNDVDVDKLWMNSIRAQEIIVKLNKKEQNRLRSILGDRVEQLSPTAIEGLYGLEKALERDEFRMSPEDVAYYVSQEISPTRLYIELGKDGFINALRNLEIDIPEDQIGNMGEIIEGGINYTPIKLQYDLYNIPQIRTAA